MDGRLVYGAGSAAVVGVGAAGASVALVAGTVGSAILWLEGAEVPALPFPLPSLAIFSSLSLLLISLGRLVPHLSAIGSTNKRKELVTGSTFG